jgi:hypothetical protein
MHLLLGAVLGVIGLSLFNKHRSKGIDKCSKCEEYNQIGTMLRYVPSDTNIPYPYCKKCKPEIFP